MSRTGMEYGNRGALGGALGNSSALASVWKRTAHAVKTYHDSLTRLDRDRLKVACPSMVTDAVTGKVSGVAPMVRPSLPGVVRHRLAWQR